MHEPHVFLYHCPLAVKEADGMTTCILAVLWMSELCLLSLPLECIHCIQCSPVYVCVAGASTHKDFSKSQHSSTYGHN